MMTRATVHGPGIRARGRWAAAWAVLAAAQLLAAGCDLLDVENPNQIAEEHIYNPSAATAVVNGALSLTANAIASNWQTYLMPTDELTWIGSRDAWQQLDFGILSDVYNEFTDAAFPSLGSARWMADKATAILDGHVASNPSPAMKRDQARAYLIAGMIYMVIGEIQEDFAFSDKTQPAPPVGPANMYKVLDGAIERLDKAVAVAREVGDAELETRALALRARAKHSRAIWDKIKPRPNTAQPLVSSPGATQDAQAVLSRVSDTWTYKLTFSPTTISNDMAAWINSRAENQFDFSIVEVDPRAPKIITGVKIRDPIDGVPDPVITAKLIEWKGGDLRATGDVYPPLTVVSARLMRLILAEDALAKGDVAGFTTQINRIRSLDGLSPYAGQIPPRDMLIYERRVNLFLMGLRLADMYRFGIRDRLWQPNADAVLKPGTLLPITIIERRANPYLRGQG